MCLQEKCMWRVTAGAVCFTLEHLSRWINLLVSRFCGHARQSPDGASHTDRACYVDISFSSSSLFFFFFLIELRACPSGSPLFPWIMRKSPEVVIVGRASNMGESACGASFPLLSSGIFGLHALMRETS